MRNSVFISAADRGVGEQLPPQMSAELLLGQLRWIKGAQGLVLFRGKWSKEEAGRGNMSRHLQIQVVFVQQGSVQSLCH